jgi:carotenoid cleavage dioxygenase
LEHLARVITQVEEAASPNPWLMGNFAPVDQEVTLTDLTVHGSLPESLDGRFLRIGPNPLGPIPDPSRHHWFVGDGMVHGLRLGDGQAKWYRNRWVRTSQVAAALGSPPPTGPVPPLFDSSNTALLALDGTAYSLTEMAIPYELTEELDTVGRTDFGGPMPNGFTAHPKVDPVTGEVHGFGYGIQQPHLVYVVISREGVVQRTVPIELHGPSSVHDFALTEGHAVFPDLPVVFSMDLVADGYGFPYRWDPDYPSRVGVLPRGGEASDVRWFEVSPGYVFHVLNAYDVVGADGSAEAVVVDVVRYDRMFADHLLGPIDGAPALHRWTIDLVSGVVHEQQLDDRPQEFPRSDPRRHGRPHRYGYGIELGHGDAWAEVRHLLKLDLEQGTTEVHDLGPNRHGSEAVFVPREDSDVEDDGWLLSFVLDAERGASDLVVVATQDMAGPPVAVVELPVRVPFGFHGCWVPDR